MRSREQVAEELSRLQRDNDSLKGKNRLHAELQQQEGFLMPGTVQVPLSPETCSGGTSGSETGGAFHSGHGVYVAVECNEYTIIIIIIIISSCFSTCP